MSVAVLHAVAIALLIQQATAQTPIEWKTVDRVLGRPGTVQGETYRVGFPRSDPHVTVGAVTVRPTLALGSWVALQQTGDSTAMLMGELVLLPAEGRSGHGCAPGRAYGEIRCTTFTTNAPLSGRLNERIAGKR